MLILIKNGTIYDGTGGSPVKQDILIHDKRIASLGVFHKKQADLTLDATGNVITPGLIEVNFEAESAAGIFSDPHQENLIKNGVTTAIGGSSGLSLAPVIGGSLDLLKEWGIGPGFNLHFRSLSDMFAVLERRGLGINFGTLIGYAPIRRFFTHGSERDLTIRELESAAGLISRSLSEGALGFSTDLGSPLGQRVPAEEITRLIRGFGKMRRVYATHLRYDDAKLPEALAEIMDVSRAVGVSTEISHFQPLREFSDLYEKALALIEKESARSDINFDVFPHPISTRPIHSFLPGWVKTSHLKDLPALLKDKNIKERVLKHLEKLKTDEVAIAEVPPALKFLEDKPLGEFAKNQGITKARAILKLMTLTGLKAKMFHPAVDKKILNDFLASQRSLITFAYHRFLGRRTGPGDFFASIESGGKLSLEKMVAKATGLVAAKYGLEKRGLIKESYYADLVIWDNWKPKTVLVNGAPSLRESVFDKKMAGAVLRAPRS